MEESHDVQPKLTKQTSEPAASLVEQTRAAVQEGAAVAQQSALAVQEQVLTICFVPQWRLNGTTTLAMHEEPRACCWTCTSCTILFRLVGQVNEASTVVRDGVHEVWSEVARRTKRAERAMRRALHMDQKVVRQCCLTLLTV
jgi:hypothetical protein